MNSQPMLKKRQPEPTKILVEELPVQEGIKLSTIKKSSWSIPNTNGSFMDFL